MSRIEGLDVSSASDAEQLRLLFRPVPLLPLPSRRLLPVPRLLFRLYSGFDVILPPEKS